MGTEPALDEGSTSRTEKGAAAPSAEHPAEVSTGGWKDIAWRVKEEIGADHVTLSAAGVSFFAFSAFLPFLALAVTLYGLVADPSDITALADRLGAVAPEQVTSFVTEQLSMVTTTSTSALSISLLLSLGAGLWSTSSAMGHLIEAMNIAYDEDTDDRPFWKRRLIAIALTLAFLATLAVSAAAVIASSSIAGGAVGLAAQLVGWLLAGIFAAGALAALYRYSPDRDDPKWVWVSPGAVFTVIAWLLVSLGFRIYVGNFGSYNETYGSLGAVIVLLFWLYLTSLVIIIGAEINAETERQTSTDTTTGPGEPLGDRGAVVADELPPDASRSPAMNDDA